MTQPLALYQQLLATRSAAPLQELRDDLAWLHETYPGVDIRFTRENPAAGLPFQAVNSGYSLAPDVFFVPEHPETGKAQLRLRKTSQNLTYDNEEVARIARAARLSYFIPTWKKSLTRVQKGAAHGKVMTADQRFFTLVQAYAALAGYIATQSGTPAETKKTLPLMLQALVTRTDMEQCRKNLLGMNHNSLDPFSKYLGALALDHAGDSMLGARENTTSIHSFLIATYSVLTDKSFFVNWYQQAGNGRLDPSLYAQAKETLISASGVSFKNYLRELQSLDRETAAAELKLFALCVSQSELARFMDASPGDAPPARRGNDPVVLPGSKKPAAQKGEGEVVEFNSFAAPATPGKRFGAKGAKVIEGAPYFFSRLDATHEARAGRFESGPDATQILGFDNRPAMIALASENAEAPAPQTSSAASPTAPTTVIEMGKAGAALKTRSPGVARTAAAGESVVTLQPARPASGADAAVKMFHHRGDKPSDAAVD